MTLRADMQSFKQQCIELRKKDKTLHEIMAITGRSKTTVWFHIKDIPLSQKKQRQISLASRERALANAAAKRGRSERAFVAFSTWTPELVLLVAHLLFDGELRRTGCGYSNRSVYLIDRVKRLFTIIYSHKPKHHFDARSGVHQIRYHNVALAAHMSNKAAELLNTISQLPLDFQREFIRAFFDDEGCMDFRPDSNQRRVRGYQKEKKILSLIQTLLQNFGIAATFRYPNEVVITGKENLVKFKREINFSRGVCLNPKRANSIWKQPIEKRELLDRAIKSFKS